MSRPILELAKQEEREKRAAMLRTEDLKRAYDMAEAKAQSCGRARSAHLTVTF